MIKSVTVTNYIGESITFDLRNPEKSGFLISSITGITPVKADINVTDITTTDGGLYNSARIASRNIVMKLVYLDYLRTIEEARLMVYKYFPSKKKVILQFETDNRKVRTEGYVESNSVQIFTKQEFSTISIICPDPYFYSTADGGTNVIEFDGVEPNFEFPFWGYGRTIEFGIRTLNTDRVITYDGDLDTGIKIEAEMNDYVGDISIQNKTTNQTMTISSSKIKSITGEQFRGGDTLTINTVKGNKSITLRRGSKTYNVLNAIDRNSKWITIQRGDNVFSVSALRWDTPSLQSTDINITITATIIYEGV